MEIAITQQEFSLFQKLIYKIAGISMTDAKKVLLVGRLSKRLRHYNLTSFSDYYRLVSQPGQAQELQLMVDLLTTNETYFFREPQHFDFLRDVILKEYQTAPNFRIWCGASSTGEEPYSLAMTLAENRKNAPWDITASDISLSVLAMAKGGAYPMEKMRGMPPEMMRKYCLKGVRAQEGSFMMVPELRNKITFMQVNLTHPAPSIGPFDMIILRNVMIYFDMETKRKVVENMLPTLKPGGYFIVGHSESLNGITEKLRTIRPTIYRKPA